MKNEKFDREEHEKKSRLFWEGRYGRPLSNFELKEIDDNLSGYFTMLYKVSERLKKEAAAKGEEWTPKEPAISSTVAPVPVEAVEKKAGNVKAQPVVTSSNDPHKPVRKIKKVAQKRPATESSNSPVSIETAAEVGAAEQKVSATSPRKVLIEEGRKILEPKSGRKLSDFEIEESLNSLTGLFELLMKWDQEKKAKAD